MWHLHVTQKVLTKCNVFQLPYIRFLSTDSSYHVPYLSYLQVNLCIVGARCSASALTLSAHSSMSTCVQCGLVTVYVRTHISLNISVSSVADLFCRGKLICRALLLFTEKILPVYMDACFLVGVCTCWYKVQKPQERASCPAYRAISQQ